MLLTAQQMKAELVERFAILVQYLEDYRSASYRLTNIGADVRSDYDTLLDHLESVLKHTFEQMTESLTTKYASSTPVTIELSSAHYEFYKSPKLTCSMRDRVIEADKQTCARQLDVLKEVADRIDFDAIYNDLFQQISGIDTAAMKAHCETLLHGLGIGFLHKPIRRTDRHVHLSRATTSYAYAYLTIEEYQRLNDAIAAVTKDTAQDFGHGLESFIQALENLNYSCEVIPTRSHFGKGCALEIICFKNKYEFRLTHAAIAAIEAFVSVHGSSVSIQTLSHFQDRLEQLQAA